MFSKTKYLSLKTFIVLLYSTCELFALNFRIKECSNFVSNNNVGESSSNLSESTHENTENLEKYKNVSTGTVDASAVVEDAGKLICENNRKKDYKVTRRISKTRNNFLFYVVILKPTSKYFQYKTVVII